MLFGRLFTLLPLSVLGAACNACTTHATTELVAALEADAELSTLLGAIKLVPGLAETLAGAKGITIFAPTDDAFAAVSKDSPEGQAIAAGDVESIASLLAYHVAPLTLLSTDAKAATTFFQTLMQPANVFASAPATLVSGGQYLGIALIGDSVLLRSGKEMTSKVVQADIKVGGAVIHKIDAVLTIPAPVTETAVAINYGSFASALDAAGICSVFDQSADITVFIPSNDVLNTYASTISALSTKELQKVLLYHLVVGSVLYSPAIPKDAVALPSAEGESITTTVKASNDSIFVNQAEVIMGDIILYNGVGHVINDLLVPSTVSTSGSNGCPSRRSLPRRGLVDEA